ncbi:MAG: IS21 family transposase [Dehalococcoidales bacterium]|nr:IS21 family transposase [Dehalococcoidales bacterium]
MRKIKEVLRLKFECNLSEREIARSCQISRTTVADYLRRATISGLNWAEAAALGEVQLVERLFPVMPPVEKPTSIQRPAPDYADLYKQLRTYRKFNLTLTQLWIEYKEAHPDGYQYSQFCEHYRRWRGKLDYVMRQEHRAGEKLFIDYCDGLSLVDPFTGEIILTQLFLAVWGASNYTYAEATLSQTLPEWIRSHVHAFEYFHCIPRVLVPDNIKSGVSKACKYEPELNPTYTDMAEHYGCAVLPARPYRPRDKAKVEVGVLIAQRWILAVLRHRTFYSLVEINAAIRECLERLNSRLLRHAKKSRRELFDTLDYPSALPLPLRPYEYAEWIKARVNFDYHIEVDDHYYSIPFQLLHERLDVRQTATTIEAFHKGKRIAAHVRSYVKGGYTTLKEHMPPQHRAYAEWSPARFIQWAGKIGEATARLVEQILAGRIYQEQAFRSCMGIIQLGRSYEPERVEAASQRALKYKTYSYRSMKAILSGRLDQRQDIEEQHSGQLSLPLHQNIRGPEYYQ